MSLEESTAVEENPLLEKEEALDRPIDKQELIPQTPDTDFRTEPGTPIEFLSLGTRISNILIEAGITTVDDVFAQLELGDAALLKIDSFGEKSLSILKQPLINSGYQVPRST